MLKVADNTNVFVVKTNPTTDASDKAEQNLGLNTPCRTITIMAVAKSTTQTNFSKQALNHCSELLEAVVRDDPITLMMVSDRISSLKLCVKEIGNAAKKDNSMQVLHRLAKQYRDAVVSEYIARQALNQKKITTLFKDPNISKLYCDLNSMMTNLSSKADEKP